MMAGSIPTEMGQCVQLIVLDLNRNELTGLWYLGIVLADYKRILSIDRHLMTGSIPSEIQLCSQLDRFLIDMNKLTGLWHLVLVVIDDGRVS